MSSNYADDLFSPQVTAHCFFRARCRYTVTDRPNAAHDAMEQHYASKHRDQISVLVGRAS